MNDCGPSNWLTQATRRMVSSPHKPGSAEVRRSLPTRGSKPSRPTGSPVACVTFRLWRLGREQSRNLIAELGRLWFPYFLVGFPEKERDPARAIQVVDRAPLGLGLFLCRSLTGGLHLAGGLTGGVHLSRTDGAGLLLIPLAQLAALAILAAGSGRRLGAVPAGETGGSRRGEATPAGEAGSAREMRRRRIASMPLKVGMVMSETITSGRRRRSSDTNVAPSVAIPTIS